MHAAFSFLAVALLGAGAPSDAGVAPMVAPAPADGGATPIRYHVRLLEMEGVKWRESLYSRLTPVSRQGGSAVWTADREVARSLSDRAGRVMLAPQVLAQPGAVAHFSQRATRKVASQLTRHADGPVDHAIAVAYTPDFQDVREGCQFAIVGRKLDQGMLVKIVVEESRVAAIHPVKLTEFVSARNAKDSRTKLSPQLDVPEVVRGGLEGEWLIPNDGVLVASLGAHTVDDGTGKAVVKERLVLVEADLGLARNGVEVQQTTSRPFSFTLPARAAAIPMPMPVPTAPSRSLPQGHNADGVPVPLPPLPEAKVPPTSLPGSAEPCATPQAPHAHDDSSESEAPTPAAPPRTTSIGLDPDSTRAKYEGEPGSKDEKAASSTNSPWNLLKPYLLRIPMATGNVEIEIRASVSPASKP